MIFKKFRSLFHNSGEQPSEEKDTMRLLDELDRNLTKNEIATEKVRKDARNLEQLEKKECEKLASGTLSKNEELFTLQTIKKIRMQLKHLEKRMSIYQKNIDLNLNLISKLENIKAMKMKGIEEENIDDIVNTFEEEFDIYTDVVNHPDLQEFDMQTDKEDEKSLALLKEEILGGKIPQRTEMNKEKKHELLSQHELELEE